MFSQRHPSINGELKSKAAVNAAADPHSTVTAEEAERTLMNEAEKAGTPAYFFDADAAPEEKAAIAHAVCGSKSCNLPSSLLLTFRSTGLTSRISST